MLNNIKKSKRRRYIRHAIRLEAVLTLGKTTAVQCFILDFCTGGFFLSFEQSSTEIPLYKDVRIQFQHAGENFLVDAQTVHVTPTSAGVSIENMPVAIFGALTQIANADLDAILQDQSGSAQNQINRANFKKLFKRFLSEKLPTIPAKFFESVGEHLERANEHSEYFPNHSLLDDFITSLQLSRESFISEFCSAVIFQVDYIFEIHRNNEELINHAQSLSLIDKEIFEDWLNISTVARKLKNRYEGSLAQLAIELGRVTGIARTNINNPISPAVLCDSFREIILQFELNNKVKELLYSCFHQALTVNLAGLYEQTGSFLVKYAPAEKTVVSADTSPNKNSYRDLKLPKEKREIRNRHGSQPSAFLEDQVALSSSYGQKSLTPISRVAGRLLTILKEADTRSPENNTLFSDGESSPSTRTYSAFTPDELISAISKMQDNVGDDSHRQLNAATLQKKLLKALENVGSQAKSFSDSDTQQIEIYGRFFETLFHDFNFSPYIESYLENIYLPLLSLSPQGNDFLAADSHPARNILNQIATLESAVKNNRTIKNINIKNALDKIVARIASESNTNPNVFAEVEHELEGLSAQVAKSTDLNIKRIIDAYEGQQKLEIARHAAQREIDSRIAGKAVPSIIPLLLKIGWQHLLVIAELNSETGNDEKQKYLKVLDDLLFWLYEQDSILNIQAGSIQKTIQFIEDNLSSVCTNIFQRDSVIEELTALLLGTGAPKTRKAIETVKISSANTEPPSEMPPYEDQWTSQVDQLCVGEWLAMFSGSGEFEPMKLIWIGNIIQVYVFVNRDGLNKLEVSKEELAEILRSGSANKIENLDAPLMDRATNLMLQKMHEKLIYNATHDQETDLFTRDEFVKQLKNKMSKLDGIQHMLCHMAVQDFRVITNVCGLAGGKQLLKKLTELMRGHLKKEDIFARLGDESFAILFKDCSIEQAYELSRKIIKHISDWHFEWQEKSFSIGVSMGLVSVEAGYYDVDQLLQHADSASISAERLGQNRVLVFTSDDENLKRQNKLYEWIGHIDKVFSQDRLFARCQQIADIDRDKNDHRHYEILLGVKDEDGSIIPPDHFIPAVERCKRMPEIDRWVIINVFNWIERNHHYFEKMDGFSINLSGQSINSEEFLEFLKDFLDSSEVSLNKITFEITETVAAESLVFTKRFIKSIKQYGCKFSLDDFGSGYSSYSYLKNLDIDYLKIDGAFVRDIANNQADVAIVKSMNEIAHSLDLKTIAEYVENNEIREILKEIGVDYAQGYEIQKPIPLADLVIELPTAEKFSFDDTDFWGF